MNNNYPLVTVIFLSYQQERYVEEALLSLLNQDYEKIELIISDDVSQDRTQEIIQFGLDKYLGPKKIVKTFNDKNLGLVPNFNKCLNIASGEIIVVAAGDDISLVDRVSKSVDILMKEGISAVSFSDIRIDENGNAIPWHQLDVDNVFSLKDYLSGSKLHASGASRAFKREVFDVFGDINITCPTEDTPYILRALYLGDFYVSKEPSIKYRVHPRSLSSPSSLYRMDVSLITNQYMFDACNAFSKNIVDADTFYQISRWIEYLGIYRNAGKELYFSKNKSLYFLSDIVFSKKIKLFDKLRLAKQAFKFLIQK